MLYYNDRVTINAWRIAMEEQVRKDVPKEFEDKILRLAQSQQTFTTKDVFTAYPNNQEFMLRYALNNLRIDKKIFMHGNKRGAFYSTSINVIENKIEEKPIVNSDIKNKILQYQNRLTDWFKRADLNIEAQPIEILKTLKELESDGLITIRGAARWTEYRFGKRDARKEIAVTTTQGDDNLKSTILSFIKNKKVVTMPMLIEELELQRYKILPVLQQLEQEEEIRHEGVKKSSKYIYKTVSCKEVEEIVSKLHEEAKVEECIDELSEFLCSDDATCISVGISKSETLEIKMMKNGNIIYRQQYQNFKDGFDKIHDMTTIK